MASAWWLSLSPDERVRVQESCIRRKQAEKAADPERQGRIRDQLLELIAERRTLLGRDWWVYAPFDIPAELRKKYGVPP